MTKKVTKQHCGGCYNDVYNHGCGGSKECWSLKDATLVKKYDIHVDQPPPYRHLKLTERPSCYKAQRWVRVSQDAIGKDGYWTR